VLLGIALANVSLYLHGSEVGSGHRPVDGTALDRTLDFVVTLLVNDRSRPIFALLFGFGLVTMVRRMQARGVDDAMRTRVLVRRHLWLIAFGAVHAALLFEGDILGMYGATGLVVLLMMTRRPRVLLVWGVVSILLLGALYAAVESTGTPTAPSDYLASVAQRLPLFAFGVLGGTMLLIVLAPMLVGLVLARRGLLDRPWEHLTTLRRLVVAGAVVGVVGSLPYALLVAEVWQPGAVATAALSAVHAMTGTAMGVAYVAAFGLWVARLHATGTARRGFPAVLAAVGERSLTCYLLQSVMLAPLLAPWGLGLGDGLGTAAAYGIALSVWLVTVAVAWVLASTGRRGPFEVLLRRLTYGRQGAAVPTGRTPQPA